jgi:hypothetical protein
MVPTKRLLYIMRYWSFQSLESEAGMVPYIAVVFADVQPGQVRQKTEADVTW